VQMVKTYSRTLPLSSVHQSMKETNDGNGL
jgi:hypothetical protein